MRLCRYRPNRQVVVVVKLFQDAPTRLSLRARPAGTTVAAALLMALAALLWLAPHTQVRCSRSAEGVRCDVQRRLLGLPLTHRRLEHVTKATIQTSDRTAWPQDLPWTIDVERPSRVVLVTDKGHVPLTSSYHSSLNSQQQAVDALNAFFRGQSQSATVVLRPSIWLWAAVGIIWMATIGLTVRAPVTCALDQDTALITVQQGLLRRKKRVYRFADVDRIAIRQKSAPYSENEQDPVSVPEELQPYYATLGLVLVLKSGKEIVVVDSMPGGLQGMALVRTMEKFRRGVAVDRPGNAQAP